MPFPLLPRRSDLKKQSATAARYQSDETIAQYCNAHYGPDKFGLPNFSKQIAQICLDHFDTSRNGSALVLGCAVGRTAFELATDFEQVTGVDFSSRFIEMANRIKETGVLRYRLPEEGDLVIERDVRLADFKLSATADRLTFRQGDAGNLDPELSGYNLIVAANLIDRLPDPARFLAGIHTRLAEKGLLVIASPYDWQEKYTPKKKWLGGLFRRGSAVKSFDELQKKLGSHFELANEPQETEFVLRKTARTFNHGISQVTVWQKK